MEHPISLGTQHLTLAELKVSSKPAKPKGKPGRKKKAAAVAIKDLDNDEDAQEKDGADTGGGNMHASPHLGASSCIIGLWEPAKTYSKMS